MGNRNRNTLDRHARPALQLGAAGLAASMLTACLAERPLEPASKPLTASTQERYYEGCRPHESGAYEQASSSAAQEEGLIGRDPDTLPLMRPETAFGGEQGALTGRVCFIAPTPKRLSRLGSCYAQGVVYADKLDIGPCRFVSGFGPDERWYWFALEYSGNFTVEQTGEYRFRLMADDEAILWVDGERVVEDQGRFTSTGRIGHIQLEAGTHRLRVMYMEREDHYVTLRLFVTPPGGTERLWTPTIN